MAGLDVVVGGHSNTFLYTGPAPDREEPEGEYPTVVKQQSGRRVLVVQVGETRELILGRRCTQH